VCTVRDVLEQCAAWNRAFADLGLAVRAIPAISCGLPVQWADVVLLEGFGAPNGMILLPSGVEILPYRDAIESKGFGFSIVEPNLDSSDPESLESTIDMLRDWGWCGPERARPPWY
jgi:hypothetical protein